jgi:zinc/manganese transport system permease protein
MVGATAAEATQVVGALLILGLLAAPAGAASRLTTHPLRALGLSAAVAVGSVWLGLAASYLIPQLTPSFAILAVATATYLAAVVATRSRSRRYRRWPLLRHVGPVEPTLQESSATVDS